MANSKFVLTALILFAGATTAEAHAQLDHASPAIGSTVSSAPGQVTLHFTEALEPKFSGASVTGPSGAAAGGGGRASGSTLTVSVKNLGPGTYTVNWHVLSVDTHKTQGSFSFHVGK